MSIPESSSNNFALEASHTMHFMAHESGVTFGTDLEALQALAHNLDSELPDEPKLVLLAGNEAPSTHDFTVTPVSNFRQPTPIVEAGDIIIRYQHRELTEIGLTLSVAQALADRKREEASGRLAKRGAFIALGGAALTTADQFAIHGGPFDGTTGAVGFAVMVGGGAAWSHYRNRTKAAPQPEVEQVEPPIRLINQHQE